MPYDLVVKNGTIVDGSGVPGFRGDIGITGDRIAVVGKVDGPARRTVNADGLTVAPGFIDSHTHMDAQICWDPIASSSCYHGVTSIIMGNCGLTLAPCRPEDHDAAIQTFIRVEDMPRPVLEAGVPWDWETFEEYLDRMDGRIGVNVGALVGHNAVRQYVMRDAARERKATDAEIREMQQEVRAAIRAGALGFSTNRNPGHIREDGSPLPSRYADDAEVFALASELGDENAGIIQTTQVFEPAHLRWFGDIGLATRRPVVWQSLRYRPSDPENYWREFLDAAGAEVRRGARLFGLSISRMESDGETDLEATAQILNSPLQLIGTSDAGAHVARGNPHFGYAGWLLGLWVRERGIMSIEEAVHRLTFAVASIYEIPDRGLLRSGYKADIVLFDPATVTPAPPEWRNDLPAGQGRYIEPARGIEMTIVNGEPLIDHDQHTGALPGQTLRNRLAAGRPRHSTAAV